MIYNDFKGEKLSALGMGCMRFPCNENGQIDKIKLAEMVEAAIAGGVNYFDTAYGYHKGQSESAIGEALSKYPRESFYLASKFPGFNDDHLGRVKEIFEEQLRRCGVEYFDFYLFHSVTESNIDGYLDPKYGVYDYLVEQKRLGRIRHLGFSTHGSLTTMERFIDAYGDELEFCQIQLNWLDWSFENARAKVKLLSDRGIPVWVMEPVRGGKLCNLSDEHRKRLSVYSDRTLAEWAFRFVQSVPEVKMTLSGMSNMDQILENIETYRESKPLGESEKNELFAIAKEMTGNGTLPCTACRYCTEKCPLGIDIPWIIEVYNENVYDGGEFEEPSAFKIIADSKKPSACLGCHACERVCPQHLEIAAMMKDFVKRANEAKKILKLI